MKTVVAAALGECVQSALGALCMTADPITKKRVEQIVGDANKNLEAMHQLSASFPDPYADPAILVRVVTSGNLDAPQLIDNKLDRSRFRISIMSGTCTPVDPNGRILSEARRLRSILKGGLQ